MSATSVPTVTALETPVVSGASLQALVAAVQEVCPTPVNVLQIAAVLESGGMTDALARKQHGSADVFALAVDVSARLHRKDPAVPPLVRPPQIGRYGDLSDYARGPLSLLPMLLLSLIITLYQNYGQWEIAQVLTLSLSMMGSLLVTSGFIQAASRKSSSYLSQGYAKTAGRVIRNSVLIAFVCMLALGGGALGIAFMLGILSLADGVLMGIAYVSLSCLWLTALGLGLLNQMHWFGIGLAVGLGVSYGVLWGFTRLSLSREGVMLSAVSLGLICALLVMWLVIYRSLARAAAVSPVGTRDVVLAPLRQILFNLAPYFIYGVLYVILILTGHTFGWLGRLPQDLPRAEALAIAELGLTLALGGFILTSGVAEHTMRRFWEVVQVYQHRISLHQASAFSAEVHQFYRREYRRYFWALLGSSAALFGGVVWLMALLQQFALVQLPWKPATAMIFGLGLVGYGALALGLFDCMFLITLACPGWAIKAVLGGAAATLALCVGLGRLISYQYGIIGVLGGGLIFMGLAHHYFRRLLAHLDYFYFASF